MQTERALIDFTSASNSASETHRQFVTFKLNDGDFAIDIRQVSEIISTPRITRLPSAGFGISGVINLRGKIVTLINPKLFLETEGSGDGAGADAVIFRTHEAAFGILVDDVREVIHSAESQIEDVPVTVRGDQEDMIEAVVKSSSAIYSVIDPDNFFNHPDHYEEKSAMSNAISEPVNSDTFAKESTVQLVTFLIGSDEFAVDIHEVQEINKMIAVTEVPRAPKFVEGIINLRGQIVPVINLRERFKLQKIEHDKNTRIIIISVENKRVGLIVDGVSEVMRVSAAAIKNPPEEAVGEGVDFVKGVAEVNERLIIVLRLDKVLSQDEVSNMSKIKSALLDQKAAANSVPMNGSGSIRLRGLRKISKKMTAHSPRKKKIAVLE